MVHRIGDKVPKVDKALFVAWNAEVAGSVTLAADTSVWFSATLRGDIEPITVGRGSNVQDGATLHTDFGLPCVVGEGVTIGHRAILHGCTVGDDCLIGMGAVVLSGAVIGKESIVGAGALVTEGKSFPPVPDHRQPREGGAIPRRCGDRESQGERQGLRPTRRRGGTRLRGTAGP